MCPYKIIDTLNKYAHANLLHGMSISRVIKLKDRYMPFVYMESSYNSMQHSFYVGIRGDYKIIRSIDYIDLYKKHYIRFTIYLNTYNIESEVLFMCKKDARLAFLYTIAYLYENKILTND